MQITVSISFFCTYDSKTLCVDTDFLNTEKKIFVFENTQLHVNSQIPYLPVYNAHPCIMRTPILKPVFRGKKRFNVILVKK